MTKPPTAAHPGNQPAPATQRRSGKGRPAKAGTGGGRAAAGKGEDAGPLHRLTEREAEAVAHLAAGRDLAETAAALGVTPATARGHQRRALRKLGIRTQDEITALAALLPAPEAPAAKPPTGPPPTDGRPADPATARTPQQTAAVTAAGGQQPPSGPPSDPTETRTSRQPTTTTTTADGQQLPGDPHAGPAKTQPPQQTATATNTAGGEQPPVDPQADHANAAAPPSRQGAVRRPVAAVGVNRPQGVRAGRAADAGAQAPSAEAQAADRASADQAVGSGAERGSDHDDRRTADGLTTDLRGRRATAKQPAESAAARTASGPDSRRTTEQAAAATEAAGGPASAPDGNQAATGKATTGRHGNRTAHQPPRPDSPRTPQQTAPAGQPAAPAPNGEEATAGHHAKQMPKGPDSRRTTEQAAEKAGGPATTSAPDDDQAATGQAATGHCGNRAAKQRAELDAKQVPAEPDSRRAPAARAAEAADGRETVPGDGGGWEVGFEEQYEATHTRLVQQVFLLTACKHRAVHCVGRAFGEARRRWAEVVAGGEPETWVRARAFELALSPWHRGGPRRSHVWRLPHRRIKVRPADEAQAVLPDHDRLTDRDRALLKALRRLSRPQRRALVLHDGLGVPAAAVALEVESTVAAAEGRVWAARAALAQWVPELVGTDPAADGFADRLCALMHRAAVRGAPEPHRPPVPLLRARHGLVNAGRTGAAALLTAAVGGAVVATLAGGGPGKLFRPPAPPPPALCAPVPTLVTARDALLPLLPDGPPSGIQSHWCSPTPGLEPVVVDPPPPGGGPYSPPTGGRAAEALPPPGTVAAAPRPGCAPLALHPCATDY